jgi:GxxExxY protein
VNRQSAEAAKLPEPDFALDEMARVVVDAAVEVHRVLGPGLLESVYEQALSVELALRSVRFVRQLPVVVTYKNVAIGEARLDFLVAERLVVEWEGLPGTTAYPFRASALVSESQRQSLGLLINFNVRLLRQGVRRVVRSR